MTKKFLARFTTFDLVIIALLSAGGVATKPFIRALTQVLAGTLIPAGALSGVFYMLWIVLACCITGKRGTAVLVGIVQSVLVVVFDMLGNRGIANLLVYIGPGITLELGLLLFPAYVRTLLAAFTAGLLANAAGSLVVGAVFMRLPLIPLLASLASGAVSGGLGGVLAYKLFGLFKRFGRNT